MAGDPFGISSNALNSITAAGGTPNTGPQVVKNPDGSTTTTLGDGTVYTDNADGSRTMGAYKAPTPMAQLTAGTSAAGALRDQFSQMATTGNTYTPQTVNAPAPVQAPTVNAPTLDVSQSNQARGIQTGGIGAQAGSLVTQGAALGAANTGLATQQAAGQSYQDVLSGKAPSVAQLQGEQQAAQNTASAYGGAAGASGGNRALALRTAMNGAGANNAQAAAQAAILRATEQANARSGLANVGAGEATTGSTIGGIGNNIDTAGQGITTGGTNIRTGDTSIATTNAANNLAGQTTNAANSLTGQTTNAANGLAANTTNAANGLTNNAADLTFKSNMAGNANTAASNDITGASSGVTGGQNQQKITGPTIGEEIKNKLGSLDPFSSQDVKQDIRPAASEQVADLFSKLNGATTTNASTAGTTPKASLIAADADGGGSSLSPGGLMSLGKSIGSMAGPGNGLAGNEGSWTGAAGGALGGSGAASGAAAGEAGEAAGDLAAAAPAAAAASSKKVKTNVKPSPEQARAMFAQITPTTWNYDPKQMAARGIPLPDTESPKHLGVIAEQVEKAGPLGKGIVKDINGTKALDLPMAVSALMAAMADIEKRTPMKKAPARG
jgi:Chaperone of endosialidase